MDEMALFAATLLHSSTNAHFEHWQTNSYSQHIALGEFYNGIIEVTDELVEAYMGIYGKIKSFPDTYHKPTGEPLEYLKKLQAFVKEARNNLPKDTEIVQLIDNIAQLIDTTIYKLQFLK
jgi:glycerophosphoryl diester phosphodiesterase